MNHSLQQFNEIWINLAAAYRAAAAKLGVTENVLWILYALRESQGTLPQRRLCDVTALPKQTLNSALRKLETEGYLEQHIGEDRRTRLVQLTEKGNKLAARTADRLMEQEMQALHALTPAEQTAMFAALRTFTKHMQAPA